MFQTANHSLAPGRLLYGEICGERPESNIHNPVVDIRQRG